MSKKKVMEFLPIKIVRDGKVVRITVKVERLTRFIILPAYKIKTMLEENMPTSFYMLNIHIWHLLALYCTHLLGFPSQSKSNT
jgi:hypothetical protein